MRRGCYPEIRYRKKGAVLVGVYFSSDYVAEHECGLSDFDRDFRIDRTKAGIDGRRVTVCPEDLRWFTHVQGGEGFGLAGHYVQLEKSRQLEPVFHLKHEKPVTLRAAWSCIRGSREFAVVSTDPKEIKALKAIFEALKNCDAVLHMGEAVGGRSMDRGGLQVSIASAIPREKAEEWRKLDEERFALKRDFEATGIEQKLKRAGRTYIALQPRRTKDGGLEFWLNPPFGDAQPGWYTLTHLEQWCEGRGPVLEGRR